MPRVILVDDHVIYRAGLSAVLARDPAGLRVVGEASDAAEAYELAASRRPEVAVVAASLPATDGFEVCRELGRRVPSCRVLMLSASDSGDLAERTRESGAWGYALKTGPAEEVLHAVEAVGRAERVFPAPLPASREHDESAIACLSPREREVFDLVVRGLSNENLAAHLQISVKTVETHRAHINRKLAVHSTADLVRFAARHGLMVP